MEGYTNTGVLYRSSLPYPPVQAEGKNRRIGCAMLENIGGQNSEMSAVARYFYDHLQTSYFSEVAEAFHFISIVEMHHLEIFGTLAKECGEDPRLWSVGGGKPSGKKYWWSSSYVQYTDQLGPMLRIAMQEEKKTMLKYQNQARWISDENVVANLRRVVLDEEQHLEIFTNLYQKYVLKEITPPPIA